MLASGLCFSLNTIIATLAFKDGLDLNTSNTIRYCLSTVLLILFQKAFARDLRLTPRDRYISLALGIPIFMMGVGYLGATRYIPVSLAVLIFYTCPFLVAFISRFTENEPITVTRLSAIALAFVGLAFALKVQSTAALSFLGISFASMAALGFAGFVTVSSLMLRTSDRQAVLLHSMSSGTVLFVLFFAVTNGAEIVGTPAGLLKVCGAGIFLTVAYITFFSGLEILGPVKSSMLMNVEPVLTILLAAVSLGERLTYVQLCGAGMVIVGIIWIARPPRKANGPREETLNRT